MMFLIEFGKVFRRKFNYLFAIVTLLITSIFILKLDKLVAYYDISMINGLFNFVFKIVLALVIFVMGINYIYSYREDYHSKISTLIEIGKKRTIRDFSAILSTTIYYMFYYIVLIVATVGLVYLRQRSLFLELKNENLYGNFLAYVVIVLLLLLFSNLIFLLMVTLFNNTNIAISLSLLYFVGGEVIAKMLESRVSYLSERIDNSILTIFTKVFNSMDQFVTFSLGNFLPLVLNIVGLIVVIFIVKLVKKIVM